MRILFFSSASTPRGGSRQALYLARGFMKQGHEVFFFTPDNSTLRDLDPEAPFWRNLGTPGEWRKNIEAALPTDNTPCVVHAFHSAAVRKLSWWGLLWRRKRVVCVAHRGAIFRPGNLLPYWSPAIDCFIANSKASAAVLHRIGVSAKRLEVVYNAVPQERVTPHSSASSIREELGLHEGEFVFGAVASDDPVKGVSILLRAFAAASLKKTKLVLLGVAPEVWQPFGADLGISDQLCLVEHTRHVADYLQVLDAFVLPSLSESMPNPLIEAIRFALPSVCSNVGGIPEILGKSGVLIEPDDAHALAAALKRMRNHHAAREAMSREAQAQAQLFDMDRRLQRMREVYTRLLRKKGWDIS